MDLCCNHHMDEIAFLAESDRIIDEIDVILDGLRVPIEKALNPLKQRDFVRLEARLARKLRRAFKNSAGDDIKAIQKLIRQVNLNKPETIERFVRESSKALKGLERAVAKDLAPIMEAAIEDMYKTSKVAQINQLFSKKRIKSKGDIATFGTKDVTQVEILQQNQNIYIQEGYKTQISNFDVRSKKILSQAAEEGLDQRSTGRLLQNAFGNTVDNPKYWDMVGSSWMNRTRNISSLQTFDDGGFDEYEILAVVDERTSQICKQMNGKRFSIKKQLRIETKATEGEELDSLTKKTPWLTTRQGEDGDVTIGVKRGNGRFTPVATNGDLSKSPQNLQRLGIAMPPFHGFCRTTVVVV